MFYNLNNLLYIETDFNKKFDIIDDYFNNMNSLLFNMQINTNNYLNYSDIEINNKLLTEYKNLDLYYSWNLKDYSEYLKIYNNDK
jgi:hypothetical protein